MLGLGNKDQVAHNLKSHRFYRTAVRNGCDNLRSRGGPQNCFQTLSLGFMSYHAVLGQIDLASNWF
jgi:hypothetical protein